MLCKASFINTSILFMMEELWRPNHGYEAHLAVPPHCPTSFNTCFLEGAHSDPEGGVLSKTWLCP
jgi:hypothetical protein